MGRAGAPYGYAVRKLEPGLVFVHRTEQSQLRHRFRRVDFDWILIREASITDSTLEFLGRRIAQATHREVAETIGTDPLPDFIDAMRCARSVRHDSAYRFHSDRDPSSAAKKFERESHALRRPEAFRRS